MTRNPSPPRVPTRSQNLSPRNLSQDALCGMDTVHMAISLGNHHWSHQHQANAVVHPVTGKGMEYMALMKDPHLQPLWKRMRATNAGDFSKAFETFQEPKHVSLSNSQTSQKTERSLTAKYRSHRQTRLLRRRRHFHGRHHNIQNPDQQHPLHRGRRHDDDGHKNYYQGTPLPRFEYMKMLLSRFPEEIVQKYHLNALAVDGWVYI
jgi:hypothetical protein